MTNATKEKRLVTLSDFQPQPIDWLVPRWIAVGKMTLVDGDPSQGKSLLTLDLAARLTTARPLPDGYIPPSPISIVLIGHEDAICDTVLPRLLAAESDSARIHTFDVCYPAVASHRLPTFPEDCDLLRETLVETQSRLVIIDPLTAFLGTINFALNDQLVRRALTPLAQVLEETRSASLLVRHLNKGGEGQKAIYRGSGSIAIVAAARTAFLVGQVPDTSEDIHIIACTKTNLALPPASFSFRIRPSANDIPVIDWLGPIDVSADDLVLASTQNYGEARSEARTFLQDVLQPGPRTGEEVLRLAAQAGIAERTLRRAKSDLGVRSDMNYADGKLSWLWFLPDPPGLLPAESWPETHKRELELAQQESDRFLAALRAKYTPSSTPNPPNP
jgi:hypothetical protein